MTMLTFMKISAPFFQWNTLKSSAEMPGHLPFRFRVQEDVKAQPCLLKAPCRRPVKVKPSHFI